MDGCFSRNRSRQRYFPVRFPGQRISRLHVMEGCQLRVRWSRCKSQTIRCRRKKSAARPTVSSKLVRQWHSIRAEHSSNGSWMRGASALEPMSASDSWMDRTVMEDPTLTFPEVLLLPWSTKLMHSESGSPANARKKTGRRQAWKKDTSSKGRSDHEEARGVTEGSSRADAHSSIEGGLENDGRRYPEAVMACPIPR